MTATGHIIIPSTHWKGGRPVQTMQLDPLAFSSRAKGLEDYSGVNGLSVHWRAYKIVL